MSLPAAKPPSFEELYQQIAALPEGVTGEFLEPGVLTTMSRPGGRHRASAKRLSRALDGFDRVVGGTGWWIEEEAEIRFSLRLLVPDLAGWRVERTPERPTQNPIVTKPDWCCEILSPTTAKQDRHVKLPRYAREGVEWIWLVDPDLRLVEVFHTHDGQPTLTQSVSESEPLALDPFGGNFDVSRFWSDT